MKIQLASLLVIVGLSQSLAHAQTAAEIATIGDRLNHHSGNEAPPGDRRLPSGEYSDSSVNIVFRKFQRDPFDTSLTAEDFLLLKAAASSPNQRGSDRQLLDGRIEPATSGTSQVSAESNLIVGVATFLADRVKDELIIAFIDRLRESIKSEALLNSIFPNTLRAMTSTNGVSPNITQRWKAALDLDLANIYDNVLRYVETHHVLTDTTAKEVFRIVRASSLTYKELRKGAPLMDVLSLLNDNFGGGKDDISMSIRFAYEILRALVLPTGQFATLSQLNALTPTELTFTAGAVYQSLRFAAPGLSSQFDSTSARKRELMKQATKSLTYLLSKMSSIAKGKTFDQAVPPLTYVNTALDILDTAYHYYCLIKGEQPHFQPSYFLHKGITIWSSIESNDYPTAAMEFGIAIDSFNTLYPNSLPATIPSLIKYATFGANLVSAKSSDEVEKAIEAEALPATSFRVKRQSDGLHINAYPGIVGAWEWLQSGEANSYDRGSSAVGITAPIGFDLNFHFFSAFVSLVDLAAPFSARFVSAGASTTTSTYSFTQIFSPGIFLYLAPWPTIPLDFGIGGQYLPKLRTVVVGNKSDQRDGIRFGLNITVDVPLFRIYSGNAEP